MNTRQGPRRAAMGRAPSGAGGIQSAQPMPPRFRSLPTKPSYDKARGVGPQVRRGAAPEQADGETVLVEFNQA